MPCRLVLENGAQIGAFAFGAFGVGDGSEGGLFEGPRPPTQLLLGHHEGEDRSDRQEDDEGGDGEEGGGRTAQDVYVYMCTGLEWRRWLYMYMYTGLECSPEEMAVRADDLGEWAGRRNSEGIEEESRSNQLRSSLL